MGSLSSMLLTAACETRSAPPPTTSPQKLSSGGVHVISTYLALEYIYLMLCIVSFKPERVTIFLEPIPGVNVHLKLRLVLGHRGGAVVRQ